MVSKKHNKLVRDKIPTFLMAKGIQSHARVLDDAEYTVELRKKLQEEVLEYLSATTDEDRRAERADIQEVLLWLDKLEGLPPDELEQLRIAKAEERGGFEDKIFLIETNE